MAVVLPVRSSLAPAASAAVGGPVILDGTDSGLHGYLMDGAPQGTWLYASKAYNALLDSATAGTDGSIAVLGAADSAASSNDCGAMAHHAGAAAGATVSYHDGVAGIDGFFADLASGTVTPRVIHVVEAVFCTNGLSTEEDLRLTAHASALAEFVNAGGGLFAQYHSYGWLTTLLPSIAFGGGGGSNPVLTDAGMATLPGLTNSDIAVPWHGQFSGDLGSLDILASESGQHVIIGGASVTLPSALTATAAAGTVATGNDATITATVTADDAPVPGTTVSFDVADGPNTGITGTATTDDSGVATFSYTGGPSTGTDRVEITATIGGGTKATAVDVVWATVPAAPAEVAATPGDGEAAVSFAAPDSGGSPITGYTVTASPGGATASGTGSPIVVAGLANGTAHTFTVVAENVLGAGPASSPSEAVTPAGPPDPPAITEVLPLNGAARVSFVPGEDHGGSDVTGFTATALPGGATATGTTSPLTIDGLDNGTTYTVTLTASTAGGTSIASAPSSAVTPVPYTAATAVVGLGADATTTMAGVAWAPPTSDGGSPVTGYLVEHRRAGSEVWSSPQETTTTSATLIGLDPDTAYEVRVRAVNAAGPGEAATSSFSTLAVPGAGSSTAVVIRDGEPVEVPVYTGPTAGPAVSIAGTPSGAGSWTTTAEGHVYTAGDATFHGSLAEVELLAPITGITPTASGGGYYLVAADGGVFSFGDAEFRGSMGGQLLNQPVQGIAPTCGGEGYYLVALDGGVFAFGDAAFWGSMGGTALNKGMVGIVPNCDLGGYWTFAADGGVFTFGESRFFGSLGSDPPPSGVVAMAATSDGAGYWLISGGGTVHPFGSAGEN